MKLKGHDFVAIPNSVRNECKLCGLEYTDFEILAETSGRNTNIIVICASTKQAPTPFLSGAPSTLYLKGHALDLDLNRSAWKCAGCQLWYSDITVQNERAHGRSVMTDCAATVLPPLPAPVPLGSPQRTVTMYSPSSWPPPLFSRPAPCSSCDAEPFEDHRDGCPNAPVKEKAVAKDRCADCDRELCWMDTYYGKDEFLAARCQPCREKRGERRSA